MIGWLGGGGGVGRTGDMRIGLYDGESDCQDINSLTDRGGAKLEHASDFNRREPTRTAFNCTVAIWAESVSYRSARLPGLTGRYRVVYTR